jgi:uncharacterized protein DUF4159
MVGTRRAVHFPKAVCRFLVGFAVFGALYAVQAPRLFRQYPGDEYEHFELPPGWQEKTEWVFARLMYPPATIGRFNRRYGMLDLSEWSQGYMSWTNDYPRADRHFSQALRRLTRIHVRSVEQPVNLDDPDDVYNWPWLYAVQVGNWKLTEAQAKTLRSYLDRGGFLMCDDFWGTREWDRFISSMNLVFPDRPMVEIENDDPIFHTVYDLDGRYQVAGEWSLHSGLTYRNGGSEAHWRGIYDDKKRLVVAVCFNSDVGDSWEWADDAQYPERYSALGVRIGVNYVVYAMTH